MDSIRSALLTAQRWFDWLPNWVVSTIVIVLTVGLAYSLHPSARRLVRHLLASRYPYLFSVFTQMRGVTQLAVIIFALVIAISVAPLGDDMQAWFARILLIAIIGLIGWTAITALNIAADLYLRQFRLDAADNLMARKHNTQVRVLIRSADVLVVVVTIGAALMTFEPVRQYGVSLFASAGVAGIVAGLAARPVLANLFAGVQLAMTQPIRIDDAVIVENEWGSIEEITSTYVVVRLWDWRRMIVPLSYFIEKPFQNWTRESSALIGSAFFYLDYRAPVGAIRDKLNEIVKASKNWNGQVVNLAVTDTKQGTIELRALMSANSAGQAFDLRCEVREKMIEFLQNEHPHALPVQRAITEFSSGPTELADAVREAPKARPSRSASR
jgi:small-conductance mechanosensitive channel